MLQDGQIGIVRVRIGPLSPAGSATACQPAAVTSPVGLVLAHRKAVAAWSRALPRPNTSAPGTPARGGKSLARQNRTAAQASTGRTRRPSRPAQEAGSAPEGTGTLAAASTTPYLLTSDGFRACFKLFSKCFSSFPHGTCALSVSCQYLALGGVYLPFGAAFPNSTTPRYLHR